MLLKDIRSGKRFRDLIDGAEFMVERVEFLPDRDFIKASLKLTREGTYYTFKGLAPSGIKGVAGGGNLDLITDYGLAEIFEEPDVTSEDALRSVMKNRRVP